jgi:hypothetical protein
MQRVYLETTIPSYLAAKPSRDVIQSARQQITSEFWAVARYRYELFASPLVLAEAGSGDPIVSQARLRYLEEVEILQVLPEARTLSRSLLTSGVIPANAGGDAVHIAVASVHDLDILVTWNCKHIANPFIRKQLEVVVESAGYSLPVLCTPERLLGEQDDV